MLVILFVTYGVMMGFPLYGVPVVNAQMIQALHFNRETLGAMTGALTIAAGLLAPLAAFLVQRVGIRCSLRIYAAAAMAAAILMATLTPPAWLVIALYAVLGACTTGAVVICQSATARWFIRRRGMAMGVVMAGSGVAGTLLATNLPLLMERHGWRLGWWLAAGLTLIAMICSVFLKSPPAEVGQLADGDTASLPTPAAGGDARPFKAHKTVEAWQLAEVARTSAIWLIVILGQARSLGYAIFTAHAVVHLLDLGFAPQGAALVMASFSASALLGKIVSGWITDYIDARFVIGSAYGLFGVGLWLVIDPAGTSQIVVAGAAVGLAIGAFAVCDPLIMSNYYGSAIFPRLLGWTTMITAPVGAAMSVLAGRWFDRVGSYQLAFGGSAVCALIAGAAYIALVRPPRRGSGNLRGSSGNRGESYPRPLRRAKPVRLTVKLSIW